MSREAKSPVAAGTPGPGSEKPERQLELAAPPSPKRGFTRRQVLHLAATASAAAGTVGLGVALLGRKQHAGAPKLERIRDHRLARAPGAAQMAICRGADPAANARRVIEAMGGMGAFVRPGERVVIKPNIGWNRLPEQAANTNPELVGELVRMAKAAGASQVWVTDVPVNTAERCFERSGIRRAVGEAGGTLVMPDSGAFREVEVGGRLLRVAEVLWPFVEADRVINVPIAKQHSLSGTTASMKNWYGVLGGHRVRLHQDIHRSVVELAAMMKPTLTVLDGTRVLLTNGPSGGSLDDVKRLDLLAASIDEVALDAFAAGLIGQSPADLPFIAEGERAGLGRADYRGLKLVEVTG